MKRIGLALALLALCVGCARYYRVTDPRSGHVYHTRDVDKRDSGAAEFTDERTRAKVTLQSSVVDRLTKEQFEQEAGVE